MFGTVQRLHGGSLSPEIVDLADSIRPDQLETADMRPCEEAHWVSQLEPDDIRRDEVHADVGVAGREVLRHWPAPARDIRVRHAGKPFIVQELFGHVLSRPTETAGPEQSPCRGLWLRLRGLHARPD